MVAFNQLFDARNVDPTQSVPQLPVGRHPVVITHSELKENKNKDGGFLELILTITEGPAKGQSGAYRLNLYHSNGQTVEIAYRQLSAICHAVGVYQVQDSQQLHNLPFMVDVGLQKSEDAAKKGYTQVERIYDRNGNEPGKPAQQGAAQPAAAAGGAPAGGWGGAPGQGQPGPGPGQQQPAAPGGWQGQPQGQQPAAQPQGAPQGAPQGQPGGWQGQPAPQGQPGPGGWQGAPQQGGNGSGAGAPGPGGVPWNTPR